MENNKQWIRKLKGFRGRIAVIIEENKKFHEQKEQELRELSSEIGETIKSLEKGSTKTNGAASNAAVAAAARPVTSAVKVESSVDFSDDDMFDDAVADIIQQQTVQQPQQSKKRPGEELNGSSSKRDKKDFLFDDEGYTIVHTDGACSQNGQLGAKAGWGIWWNEGHPDNIGGPVAGGRHTNNTAEIQAATFAISQAGGLKIKKLNVHTDSQFLINCITKWIVGWKRNNWVNSKKQPVINKEDIQQLELAIEQAAVKVKWTYVKGHSGIRGNDEADRLAREGASRQPS